MFSETIFSDFIGLDTSFLSITIDQSAGVIATIRLISQITIIHHPPSLIRPSLFHAFRIRMSYASEASGNNAINSEDGVQKSKNQLKSEAKRAAKLEKLAAKQSKPTAPSERKIKDIRVEEAVPVDSTPVGEKKRLADPLPGGYAPKYVEAAWCAWWERSGFFRPEYHADHVQREKFVIIMPPPNVTGSLHIGHAMMGSIEDALVRWHRMLGKSVLYVPGCDHAGIATQVVVEKKIKKEENLTRHDLGREAFVQRVWQWRDKYGHRIYDQLRRLGLSVDWDRARFTMDEGLNEAVKEAFIRLHEKGLIFRDNRLVNWCGKLNTAISDLEVENREIEGPTMFAAHGHPTGKTYPFGKLWAFAYRLQSGDGEIVIETTRPETVFADSAVAVHPNDARYKHLIGQQVIHPITNKLLPIIGDEAADPQFGTGALKISPAHDPVDFVVGKRHGLDFPVIFDANNGLIAGGPEYEGLPRYEARLRVIEQAQRNGTLRGDRPHKLTVPVCARSGDFVEPRLIPQWWMSCAKLAAQSLQAAEAGTLGIFPESERVKWRIWLSDIRDWCLSRQLWWGHRIPMYQVQAVKDPDQKNNGDDNDGGRKRGGLVEDLWVAGRNEQEAREKARAILKHDAFEVHQDPDVLDTWFSSALWPFSTMGWPKETGDLQLYYPNSLLETGSDILFFWVARMVMMGLQLTGRVPFAHVFLHAIVRDAHGRKMSKSLGNVIDPIEVIEGCTLEALQAQLDAGNLDPKEVKMAKEGQRKDFPQGIPECGTDALRFALCSHVSAQMRDVNLDISKVHSIRKFCNKIWNAFKFSLGNLSAQIARDRSPSLTLSKPDQWILSRLEETCQAVQEAISAYNLMNATNAVYHFWMDSLCDVYIEALKPTFLLPSDDDDGDSSARKLASRTVLHYCMDHALRLIHPFMPFLSEELWQRLPHKSPSEAPSLCIAPYPQAEQISRDFGLNAQDAKAFDELLDMALKIRSCAADKNVPRGSSIRLVIDPQACPKVAGALLDSEQATMASLVKAVGNLSITSGAAPCPIGDCASVEIACGVNAVFSCSS
jgi:valyl-tRNA synthetase